MTSCFRINKFDVFQLTISRKVAVCSVTRLNSSFFAQLAGYLPPYEWCIFHLIYNNLLISKEEIDMGKVVSAVANFATKVVTTVAKVLGPVGTVIVGAIVLGPIGLVGALVGANVATSITITDIKKRIEKMIKDNEQKVKEAEQLKKILERCFFDDQTFEYLLKLGKQLRSNLQIVLQDQKQKIKNLKDITLMRGLKADDYNTAGQGLKTLIGGVTDLARLALDGVSIASGNPMGIVMAAIDIGMMTFMNVKTLFNNIEQIQKLQQTEKDLKEYLKPGGEFEKQMKEIVTYAINIVRNLCTVCYFWNSLVNELAAWIHIFQVLQPTAKMIKFDELLKKLALSPITPEFVEKVTSLQKSIDDIVNSKRPSHQQLHLVYELVLNFEKQNPVEQVFAKVKVILMDFTEDSIVYSQLKEYIKEFSDINFLIDANKHLFIPNEILDKNKTPQQRDQQILDIIRERVTVNKQLPLPKQVELINGKLLLVVGANTEKFYADDPSGQTLFGLSIASIREKGNYMKFLNSAGGDFSKSIIQEPEPLPQNVKELNRHRQVKREMLKRWNRNYKQSELKDFKLFLKIEALTFNIGKVKSNRLKLMRVIQDKAKNTYSCSNDEVMRTIYKGIEDHNIWPPPDFEQEEEQVNPIAKVRMESMFFKQESQPETDDQLGNFLTTELKPDRENEILRDASLESILQKGEDFIKAYANLNTIKDITISYDKQKQYYRLFIKTGQNRKNKKYIYRSDIVDLHTTFTACSCNSIETKVEVDGQTKKVMWILAE